MTHDVDVLVIGGGPVGLAAAIETRMRGFTVAVVEPRTAAIDKACGEGLMPGAVEALARLGVMPDGLPLRGVSYHGCGRQVDHLFARGSGLGVRRMTLSAALSARAELLGIERIAARIENLVQDTSGVSAGGVRARYLLGADGLHSTVRRLAGLERPPRRRRRRFGLRRHFAVEPWTDLIEVHWTPDVEAYVTPVTSDSAAAIIGIAVLGPQGTDFDSALAGIPELAHRVKDAVPASSLRGAGPFNQRTLRRSSGRVLLIGDASGYVDAITGEGIRVGLAQAAAAVACIARDDLSGYEREWSKCTRDFRLLTSGLVMAASSPLRSVIVPTAAALPRVFGTIVDRLAR